MKKLLYLLILGFVVAASSCNKAKVKPTPIPPPVDTTAKPSKTGSTLDLIKDSVYLYDDEEYLWYASLPTYATFKPRTVTGADDKTALDNEVNQLSQFAINPATGKPYEYYGDGTAKYAFLDDGTEQGRLNGVNGDFGFQPGYETATDLRVAYVYAGSPADLAGLKRGYKITAINGRTSLGYDVGNFGDGSGNNYNFITNAIFYSNTLTMTVLKPDATSINVSLSTANYNVNPVLTYKTFDEGNGHIVGYIVFNSFTSTNNAEPQLNTAFNYFTSQGVTDLVVDLRYNGGGVVSTAEYLDDLIVPSSKNGTTMYTAYYNDKLQSDNYPLLATQFNINPGDFKPANNTAVFNKVGSLNITRVFFIITGSTASASELTINNLRPEMDVEYIGNTSYGKPVGFFGIPINKYTYYTPEFSVLNSAGQGGYYSGFTPGDATHPGVLDNDDVTKDFGDPTEGLLAHALNFVKTGTYSISTPAVQSLSSNRGVFSIQDKNIAALKFNHQKSFGLMIQNKKLKPKFKR